MVRTSNCLLSLVLTSLTYHGLSFVIRPSRCTKDPPICRAKYEEDDDRERQEQQFLQSSLKRRQQELMSQQKLIQQRWRSSKCQSGIGIVVMNDWIRRMAVDWPLVAMGSASGSLYVGNLETSEILAQHESNDNDTEFEQSSSVSSSLEETLRLLYGAYDGGGTIAIAFGNNLVAQANRDGGLVLWRLVHPSSNNNNDKNSNNDSNKLRLVSQGRVQCLEGKLVTALHLEDDYLWVGTADGDVSVLDAQDQDDQPLALQKPLYHWSNLKSGSVLCLHYHPELECAVAATSHGCVQLLALEEPDTPIQSIYPPFDGGTERKSSNVFPRSVALVQVRQRKGDSNESVVVQQKLEDEYAIACGGNDGSLYVQTLNMLDRDTVDLEQPFTETMYPLRPRHFGPIHCMTSPSPGLLVTAGQDGTMRVWDMPNKRCLYQFVGYKVWIGSLWSDGVRLVSDGADNTLIMHNFAADETREEVE